MNKHVNDNRVSKKKNNLSFKKAQIYFYEGNLDSLDNYLNKEFSDLSFNDYWFNDILEYKEKFLSDGTFKIFRVKQLLLKQV